MLNLVTSVLGLVQTALPLFTTSAQVGQTVQTLTQVLPLALQEASNVAPMLKNIISALSNHAAVTPDQIAQLKTMDQQCDIAFEAAANAAEAEDAAAQS